MVSVEFNGDFFRVITMSKGMLSYAEPSVDAMYLDTEVGNAALGRVIRQGMSLSRQATLAEFQEIFKSKIVESKAKERDNKAIEQFGYAQKCDMDKYMNTCLVKLQDGNILIQPTHQNSLDTYTISKDDGPFPVCIDEYAGDEELGATLRHAMTQCTSSIR